MNDDYVAILSMTFGLQVVMGTLGSHFNGAGNTTFGGATAKTVLSEAMADSKLCILDSQGFLSLQPDGFQSF